MLGSKNKRHPKLKWHTTAARTEPLCVAVLREALQIFGPLPRLLQARLRRLLGDDAERAAEVAHPLEGGLEQGPVCTRFVVWLYLAAFKK